MRTPLLAFLTGTFLLALAGYCQQPPAEHSDPVAAAVGAERSPQWPKVRADFLATHGECAVCGSKKDLEAHHVKPFHLRRDLELDPNNLIALCRDHHFLFGHLCSWSSFNPNVREDAAAWRKKIKERP